MELTHTRIVPAAPGVVWNALNDVAVLKDCIPGCEALERVSDNDWRATIATKIGPVSARFAGRIQIADVSPPTAYTLKFEGQGGAAGFANGEARVTLAPAESGQTALTYVARAQVGGKLAQIGSRLVDAAAKKVADDFFRAFNERMAGPAGAREEAHEEHHPEPVPRDPDLPTVSETTLVFVAAGSLVVVAVALAALL